MERGAYFPDIRGAPRGISKPSEFQDWTHMVAKSTPTIVQLVSKFYANIYEYGEGHFMIALRGHTIRVDSNLISTFSHTLRVPNSKHLMPRDNIPSRSLLVECFTEGRTHDMAIKGTLRF